MPLIVASVAAATATTATTTRPATTTATETGPGPGSCACPADISVVFVVFALSNQQLRPFCASFFWLVVLVFWPLLFATVQEGRETGSGTGELGMRMAAIVGQFDVCAFLVCCLFSKSC